MTEDSRGVEEELLTKDPLINFASGTITNNRCGNVCLCLQALEWEDVCHHFVLT